MSHLYSFKSFARRISMKQSRTRRIFQPLAVFVVAGKYFNSTGRVYKEGCRDETRHKPAGIWRWKPLFPPTPFLRAEGSHPFSRFRISPAKVQRYIAA